MVGGGGAGGDQCAELGVCKWLDQGRFVAGCLDAGERVGVDLAAGGEPGGEAADRELADAGGAGRRSGVEQLGDPGVERGATHRQEVVVGTPAQVPGRAVGVDGDRARALVLSTQGGLPVGDAVEAVGGDHRHEVGHVGPT
jgi:hypothetical protein